DLVDITAMVDGYFDQAAGPSGADATPLRRGNFAARMRMSVLYDRSVTFGGLVVGTGNKTEGLIGYTTLFGDSASAFNPIGDCTRARSVRSPWPSACPRPSCASRRPPTCGPGRPTRPRAGSAIRSSTDSC